LLAAWRASKWRNWHKRSYKPVAEAVGINGARPYDLRHAFASLLIHEGGLRLTRFASARATDGCDRGASGIRKREVRGGNHLSVPSCRSRAPLDQMGRRRAPLPPVVVGAPAPEARAASSGR